MRAAYIVRVQVILFCASVVALALIGRLYHLQIVHGAEYRNEAASQYVESTSNLFDRGDIYFTKKDGERIAASVVMDGYVLAIKPNIMQEPKRVFEALRPYIDLDRETFMAHAAKADDPYEEIAHQVDRETAAKIRELELSGVALYRETWRYYPADGLASHALGFVGYGADGHERVGLYGLERYWQSVLSRSESELYVNFFAELFANVAEGVPEEAPRERAGDVVTSIEPSVQRTLQAVLRDTQEAWQAKQLAGLIMDPQTGDVIALGALPTYNTNHYADVEDLRVYQNPLVEDVYEMGSIVKPVAMAIGLDEGAVTPETTYDDTGMVRINGYPIRNYDGRARGEVDMQEVLNQSLNVGMAHVAREVGGERLGERMRALGFGQETGIDLPNEVYGLVDNLTSPREVEYATAAFGQGIALTPVATARALAALGNGGYLVTPHLVQTIDYEHGREGNVSIDERTRVFSEETSEEITRMLVNVVDDALRHGEVAKEHYSIAAKTGTAQIAKTTERGYYEDKFLHSFFGYFPAYEPRFLIFLFHTEPQGAQYASETLTDPFMELVDFLINYYEIPPDR